MTGRAKWEANADRLRRFEATDWRCIRCWKRPEEHGDVLQLAHRLRKGLVSKYGAAVVHHALSAVPSCSKCNQLLLVHSAQEKALVARIEALLESGESLNLREAYWELHEELMGHVDEVSGQE